MANLNDFKIIKAKSAKMFQFLEIDSDVELTDVQKERFGFYHLALEGVLGMVDLEGENYTIIDGDYNKIIAQKAVNDYNLFIKNQVPAYEIVSETEEQINAKDAEMDN